jgi:glycosyltransferase involved in cell wall biosynthesis
MRVTLVTGVFLPEPVVTAHTSAEIAEELVRLGHSVHILAPYPNRPKGRLFEGYKRALFSTTAVIHGYELTHCFGTFSSNSTMLSRLAENLSFGLTAGLRLLCGQRPDVIYSNSWPIFATGIVACIARLRSVPLVISVQDVYPESLGSQLRMRKQRWFYRLLRQCDLMISRSAKQIIVISPRYRQLYETDRGVLAENLHVVQNWGNDAMFGRDTSAGIAFRQVLGIPKNAFVAVYAGNIGFASNAEMLVDVFAKLKDRSEVYLVIAGDGSRLSACQEKAAMKHLERVLIHSPWKSEETAPILQMADVLLLPTKGRQSLNSIPSKLIAYFFSGRPVIAAVLPESDTGMAVLRSGAGWVVDPDSVDLMAEAIVAASGQATESLSQMGSAGREYAIQNFTRESNLPQVIHIVEQAARSQNRGNENQPGATSC